MEYFFALLLGVALVVYVICGLGFTTSVCVHILDDDFKRWIKSLSLLGVVSNLFGAILFFPFVFVGAVVAGIVIIFENRFDNFKNSLIKKMYK